MNPGTDLRYSITGGRVIDPANGIDEITALHVADGIVVGRGHAPEGFTADATIDASDHCVCPGLVDLCARTREPGMEYKGTIASETLAAASAGVTTLCSPPDSDPVVDTPAVVELIRRRSREAGRSSVEVIGALTCELGGERLSEMAALKEAGCRGVSNACHPIADTLVARRALEYAATFDLTVFLSPMDPWLAGRGVAHEGAVATRLGIPAIPEAAETVAVARDLALIEQTGVRAHFCRLTSTRAVRMVARAQYDGVPVSADVAIPYLYLSEMDISNFESNCHVIPPLRTPADREGLLSGVRQGTLGVICSDHQPHEADAKLAPFAATEPGISGLETLLPLTLRLVQDGVIDLPTAINRVSTGPAGILGLDCGNLAPGRPADICIFDPGARWRLEPGQMLSKGHNTPFGGWEMTGRVTHTLAGGRLIYQR